MSEESPKKWVDVAHLAVCLFGAAAILFALGHCSVEVVNKDQTKTTVSRNQ